MGNFFSFLLILGIISSVIVLDSNQEVNVKICKSEKANIVFAGDKRDYDFLMKRDMLPPNLVCVDKIYKKQDWYTIRSVIRNSMPIK